jgi:hypothetical protein
MKIVLQIRVAIAAMLLLACSSGGTSVTGSYKDPKMPADLNYKKIFVVALTANKNARQKVETSLAESITNRGFQVVKSVDVLPPELNESENKKELVRQKVGETKSDALLTVVLIDEKTQTKYIPGQEYPVSGNAYYGDFDSYYDNWRDPMNDDDYYTAEKNYFVETNLYDAKSGKIVWSAQSKTMNPATIDAFLKDYKKSIGGQMKKDGLIK